MPAPNLQSSDFYQILGVNRNADDNALKKAYKKLAVKWHPDKNPGNEQATKNFQKVSEAYATLSDKRKRQIYDSYGAEAANQADSMPEGAMPGGGMPGGMPAGFHGFPGGGFPGGGGGAQHMSPEEAQRMFGSFFGGSDPFGGMFGSMGGGGGMPGGMGGTGGGPNIQFSSSMPGGMGGGPDPISMMFNQGGGMPAGFGGSMGGGGMPAGFGGSMGGGGMPAGFGGMPGGAAAAGRGGGMKLYDAIPSGTVISLKELRAAPERNGDRGVIKQYVPSKGRYVVALEDSDETMSVKPQNLLQHVHVRLHDIVSQQELNGKTGTVIAWNPSSQRYNIYVTVMKKVVSLKPSNVVLDNGTVAQLVGLNSKPELNGKWGTIKNWIRESNKYDVQLSRDKIIRVKVETMRV